MQIQLLRINLLNIFYNTSVARSLILSGFKSPNPELQVHVYPKQYIITLGINPFFLIHQGIVGSELIYDNKPEYFHFHGTILLLRCNYSHIQPAGSQVRIVFC